MLYKEGGQCLLLSLVRLFMTLHGPMDCSPPGSSVHGILQARILEWVVISFSRVSSCPRDQTQVLLHCWQILYHLSHQGSPPERVKALLKVPAKGWSVVGNGWSAAGRAGSYQPALGPRGSGMLTAMDAANAPGG